MKKYVLRLTINGRILKMDKLISSFIYNYKSYPNHYIISTFKQSFNITTILKSNEFTKILLPYNNGLYKQTQTAIKISSKEQFFKYVELLKPYKQNIIGFKLVGTVFDKKNENIKDFIYYEKQEMNDDIEFFKNYSGLLSYSEKNNKFISTTRIYEKHIINDYKNICYYEAWINNIELPWKSCIGKHYVILKSNILTFKK